MKCLFTDSKILLIEILESFINDKRLMLTYYFVSEVVKFITRIDIKENNKTKRSKNYYVLMGLIFLKIVKMFPIIFEFFSDNLNSFQIFSSSYRTTFYSMTLAITFLTFSNFILVKNIRSAKISATDLFIIFLIFLTPQKNFIIDLFLFFEPKWFIYLEVLTLFYKYMPFILISGVFLRFTIRYLGIFTDLKIAFISDGNRRYLRENNISKEVAKLEGIYKIYEIAIASMNLGIKEVGFYCFSIKNFNRPKSEINSLMNVIESGRSKFNTKNIKIKFKVYGRLNLLKENVKNELIKLMDATKNNKDITVNLFIAYTTTDELGNGIVFNGDVDLIIRTSGEQRLSDFLVRHVAKGTHVFFAKPYWPELTIVQLILILVKYKLEKIFFK